MPLTAKLAVANLRQVEYIDAEGRKWARLLPEAAKDSEAEWGVPLGPAPISDLGLPLETEIRLHNELYTRGILTVRDAKRRRLEVAGALMAALRVDIDKIVSLYGDGGSVNGNQESATDKSLQGVLDRGRGRPSQLPDLSGAGARAGDLVAAR